MLGFMTVMSIGNVLNMHMIPSMIYIIENNKKAYLINQIGLVIGGEGGIRTHDGLQTHAGFQDRCIQPLCHLSKTV